MATEPAGAPNVPSRWPERLASRQSEHVSIVRGLSFFGALAALIAGGAFALSAVGTRKYRQEGFFTTVRYNPPRASFTLWGRWWKHALLVASVLAVVWALATLVDLVAT